MILFGPALRQGEVGLVNFPGGKLLRQFAMGVVVLGNYHQSAGGAVEAMNDPGTKLAADFRQCSKMMQQRIHQGAAVAGVVGRARAGVNHHPRWLIDDRQIAVFVDDVERNFFRQSTQRRSQRRARNRNFLSALEPQ